MPGKNAIGIRGLRRFGGISRVLAKHGFGTLLDRTFKRRPTDQGDGDAGLETALPSARRVRLALEELGPSFIKLGQLISTRADVFPKAYVDELRKLQDSVPAIDFENIQPFIEHGLGRPIADVFASFEPQAIAAASVAQVHKARLSSGADVAVKVVRPGIEEKIRSDIRVMYYFAAKFEKTFEIARIMGAQNVVKEFERTIFNELDMHIEAGSMEKFTRNFRLVNEIHVPEVYWDLTTKSVLVMEYVPGVKVDQVAEIECQGTDPKDIAMIGLRSLSRQLMEFGFVHADPHPGNTIVMPDGRVGLVDFGIMAHLDEELMLQLAHLFLGYAEHDYDLVMEALLDAGLIDEDQINTKEFRNDIKDISEPFYGRSLQTISVRDVYEQVMRLVSKYRIRLPRNLLLLLKTLIQTEALGKILGSDASILHVIKPYARELLQRGYDSQKIFRTVGREARMTGTFMRTAPKFVYDILRHLAQGRQRINIQHGGFDPLLEKFERGLNRFIVGIIIAASTIAGALILNSPEQVMTLHLPFLGSQAVTLTSLLGVAGYSIATLLGIWLIVSIIRSGKL